MGQKVAKFRQNFVLKTVDLLGIPRKIFTMGQFLKNISIFLKYFLYVKEVSN
jgi:hypothetical protein